MHKWTYVYIEHFTYIFLSLIKLLVSYNMPFLVLFLVLCYINVTLSHPMRKEQTTINSNWNRRISRVKKKYQRRKEKDSSIVGAACRFSFRPLFATQFRSLLWLLFFRFSTASLAVYMCRDRQPYWHLCTDTLLRFVAVQQAVQYTVRCCFSPGPANPVPKSIRVYLRSPSISWFPMPILSLSTVRCTFMSRSQLTIMKIQRWALWWADFSRSTRLRSEKQIRQFLSSG